MTMKRAMAALAVLIFFGAGWTFRGAVRDAWHGIQRPALPSAQPFSSVASVSTPSSINLAVPFLGQAPKGNWAEPYQDACEEASAIMVDAYYRGRTAKFAPDEGDRAILELVAFEKKFLGFYEDTTATTTASFIRAYFRDDNILVRDLKSADEIKAELANGHPVMVPAYGKALRNPHFRGSGPLYHMLVVKGYLADGRLIVNDPGTRIGADYVYAPDVLLRAAHDWNGGDVPHGKPMMIVVLPN